MTRTLCSIKHVLAYPNKGKTNFTFAPPPHFLFPSNSLEVRQELLTGSGESLGAENFRLPGSQVVVSQDETLVSRGPRCPVEWLNQSLI